MFARDLGNAAKRFLRKLPQKHFGQVDRKIEMLREDPFPPDSKLLKGYDLRRTDIGEYRIAYKVIGNTLFVPLIGKRNDDDIYKRLGRLHG